MIEGYQAKDAKRTYSDQQRVSDGDQVRSRCEILGESDGLCLKHDYQTEISSSNGHRDIDTYEVLVRGLEGSVDVNSHQTTQIESDAHQISLMRCRSEVTNEKRGLEAGPNIGRACATSTVEHINHKGKMLHSGERVLYSL